ncbi:MAG: glycoside hydrolase/phage tail family protein [Pseudomonadota bacterium]
MATLLLGSLGGAIGGVFGGPIGAVLGKAIGSTLGNVVDHQLFGEDIRREGPRLKNLDVQTSTEGAGIPIVYGRARLSGQMIWATRYEEEVTTTSKSTGGKGGGPKVKTTTYSYYANFAIGLCEGTIGRVTRVWADGKPLDLENIVMRVHDGRDDQAADPLIESKEGSTPAYRGLAYAVFERMPLEAFGNRIPQLAFEVVRPIGALEPLVKAVTIIPGATAFGYDPEPVSQKISRSETVAENNHNPYARSDWEASLDDLQSLCPNLERVALIVAWFGDSLDAATCTVTPRIEDRTRKLTKKWSVAGVKATSALEVSRHEERAAYGSTPDDASVLAAIADLRARGLKVTLMPFIMMDVPEDNVLIDPYTGSVGQKAYPWRGEITVSPAPGLGGTPDGTSLTQPMIDAFVGNVTASDFAVASGSVSYNGPSEWSFSRFILHMAALAKAAEGVDAFVMGSEMRGITTVRDAPGSYPFVDRLVGLAGEVRQLIGAETVLTYGADWSEYSNHQPNDGSGDLHFHLDPLWSSPEIDVIGIDQYQPITDWRYESGHLDAGLGASASDPAVIKAGLSGGENADWYYASDADREAQVRTPITDGAYGEPWVYKSKDLVSWWSNAHHNRVAGVRETQPTGWVPMSKPLWLTEFGAPATDLAGNRPSAFPSDKPSADALPPFSRGERDDDAQRAILTTALSVWSQQGGAENPLSSIDGRAMIDPSAIHLWTWDARPFPTFPLASDVWSDSGNWYRGHWLNGRLGASGLADLLATINARFDLPALDVSGARGVVEGYILPGPASARGIIDDLSGIFGFLVLPAADGARVAMRSLIEPVELIADDLAARNETPLIRLGQTDSHDAVRQVTLGFRSPFHDHRTGIVRSDIRPGHTVENPRSAGQEQVLAYPLTLDPAVAQPIAERMLHEAVLAGQTLDLSLPPSWAHLEAGDCVAIAYGDADAPLVMRINRLTDGQVRRLEAHAVDPGIYRLAPTTADLPTIEARPIFGPVDLLVLDLPPASAERANEHGVYLAAYAKPWPGAVNISFEPTDGTGETTSASAVQQLSRPSSIGSLVSSLPAGPVNVPDRSSELIVDVPSGSLESLDATRFLEGGNRAAIVSGDELEIIAYQSAELIGVDRYRLRTFLRGLAGTGKAAGLGAPEGSRFVVLDQALERLDLPLEQVMRGGTITATPVRSGQSGAQPEPVSFAAVPRSLEPLAPAHLKAKSDGADWLLSWVRCARGQSGVWSLAEVPLVEETELYELVITVSGTIARTERVTSPSFLYTAAQQSADGVTAGFGAEVRQLGFGQMLGASATLNVDL